MMLKAKIIDGKLIFENPQLIIDFTRENEGKDVEVRISVAKKKRTLRQNSALHKYFTLLAEELNLAGLDMRKLLKEEIDISWTPESVKEYLWRPIQKVMYTKESTTKLETNEITKIYDVLNRHLSEKHGIGVMFPSEESMIKYLTPY